MFDLIYYKNNFYAMVETGSRTCSSPSYYLNDIWDIILQSCTWSKWSFLNMLHRKQRNFEFQIWAMFFLNNFVLINFQYLSNITATKRTVHLKFVWWIILRVNKYCRHLPYNSVLEKRSKKLEYASILNSTHS